MFQTRIALWAALLIVICAGCKREEKAPAVKTDVRAAALLVVGDVKSKDRVLKTGDLLHGDDEIRVGAASMVDLQVKGTQATMRIKENSVVRISALHAAGRKQYTLNVDSGRILVNLPKRSEGEDFRVVTPAAVASVRGTKFDVYVFSDGKSKTVVFEGSVTTRVRISELESLPPELLENSQALRKVVQTLAEKERVVEAGQESTVTHYVVDASLKAQIDQVRANPTVQEVMKRPMTPEEARKAAADIDRDLADRLADIQTAIQQAHPEAVVEVKAREPTPREGFPVENEFDEFKAVPDESLADDKAAAAIAQRNQDAEVRGPLLMRIERVTGGKLDKLSLKDGRVVEGAVRQVGEDYLVTTPEGSELITSSQVAEIRF
jgi:hypothetical protein